MDIISGVSLMAGGHTNGEVGTVLSSTGTTFIASPNEKKLEFNRAVFSPGDSRAGTSVPAFVIKKTAKPYFLSRPNASAFGRGFLTFTCAFGAAGERARSQDRRTCRRS